MKIWVDDVRPAPIGYYRILTVNHFKTVVTNAEKRIAKGLNTFWEGNKEHSLPIELIDLDHDAGDYASDGGDYINILNWLEETGRSYPIRFHSMNPVGVENMRRIIERNGWREIK